MVLAAASLTEAFAALAGEFDDAHPGRRVVLAFAGSQTLAAQLRAGADGDVIATAHPEVMRSLEADGLVAAPRAFATNRLVWIVSRERRAEPPSAGELAAALRRERWRVVVAAPEVPAGRYARDALERLDLIEVVDALTVSRELDVKGVIAKVRLAGADAGLVYATDVTRELRPHLHVVELPERGQVRAVYLAARARESARPAAAEEFLDFLTGEPGRRVLATHGFAAP